MWEVIWSYDQNLCYACTAGIWQGFVIIGLLGSGVLYSYTNNNGAVEAPKILGGWTIQFTTAAMLLWLFLSAQALYSTYVKIVHEPIPEDYHQLKDALLDREKQISSGSFSRWIYESSNQQWPHMGIVFNNGSEFRITSRARNDFCLEADRFPSRLGKMLDKKFLGFEKDNNIEIKIHWLASDNHKFKPYSGICIYRVEARRNN